MRVYEVAFWDPTETSPLERTSRAPSCPDFIDVEDPFTLLLHQGLIERSFLAEIDARRTHLPAAKLVPAPFGGVFRPYSFLTCTSRPEEGGAFPCTTEFEHSETKKRFSVRSKYIIGVDGARSLVRRAISGGQAGDGEWQGGIKMLGDASDIIWGVMDVEVTTDFPDIKSKCLIHSRDAGSIMVIPREKGLVRLYVQLKADESDVSAGAGTDKDGETTAAKATHVERSKATQEICMARARKIFAPFTFEFGYVDWFSVYQIGQRIASNYTLDQRVFLGGDATHTHSPKAGQGMNISMLDTFSLAWKINLVEKGMADPAILLPTYEQERRGVAEELLAFDSQYSKLFSGRSPKADQLTADHAKAKSNGAVDAQLFIETFKRNAEFTSGCGAFYQANVLNATDDSALVQGYPKQGVFNPAGSTLVPGRRLLPGKLTRAVDANQVRIQQEVQMNGAFRIHLLAGEFAAAKPILAAFDAFLASPSSFLNAHRPAPATQASIFDRPLAASQHIDPAMATSSLVDNPFFTFLTVFTSPHTEWEIEDLPFSLRRYRDQVYSDDRFDRRVPDKRQGGALHAKYGLDKGGIVVVRPDGYVGAVVKFDADGFEALNKYFAGFLRTDAGAHGKL